MGKIKFLRRISNRYSCLGKGRKKKQKWRKPTGRHNKMREKRVGKPCVVSIGYGKQEKQKRIMIQNVKDLDRINNEVAIVGKVGKKKKIEIAKKAKEKGIKLSNLNVSKLLRKEERQKNKENKK